MALENIKKSIISLRPEINQGMLALQSRQKEEPAIAESIKALSHERLSALLRKLNEEQQLKQDQYQLELDILVKRQAEELEKLERDLGKQLKLIDQMFQDPQSKPFVRFQGSLLKAEKQRYEAEFEADREKTLARHLAEKDPLIRDFLENAKIVELQKQMYSKEAELELALLLEAETNKTKAQVDHLTDLAKMFCQGFYYKGLEEQFLGLFKESLESLQNAESLATSFLGPHDDFAKAMKKLAHAEKESIARKKRLQKAHEIDWKSQDMARKRSAYSEVFNVTSNTLKIYEFAIPRQFKKDLDSDAPCTPAALEVAPAAEKAAPSLSPAQTFTMLAHFL